MRGPWEKTDARGAGANLCCRGCTKRSKHKRRSFRTLIRKLTRTARKREASNIIATAIQEGSDAGAE